MSPSASYVGLEYSAFDGLRKWELLYEEFFLVLLDTRVKRGNDSNLVGIDTI